MDNARTTLISSACRSNYLSPQHSLPLPWLEGPGRWSVLGGFSVVVFEVSSLLKAKCYSSALVSVLNSWWPSGFMWDRGRERCYICLPLCRLPWLFDALPSPVPQFHSERRIFPQGLHCCLLCPSLLLGSVSISPSPDVPSFSHCRIDWFLRHRDRPYAKSKVHTSGKHGAFLTSFVFLQLLIIPTTKQNKKAKCIC